ncbi:MAG: protein translocase subunit SecD [Eggerthellaceae bacterium]|nr:protein translocase subunit SecD [Eggerthellaceae bacterium]
MPPQDRINQGLDIQGGLSVVLSANNNDGSEITPEDMEKSRSIIENRVNALGANEAVVQLQGSNQILVQIPGLTDTQEALDTIGKTGVLEFARLDSFTNEEQRESIEQNGGITYTLNEDALAKLQDDAQTVTAEGAEVVSEDADQVNESGGEGTSEENTSEENTSEELDASNLELTEDSLIPVRMQVEQGDYTPIVTGENIRSVAVTRESDVSTNYAVSIKLDSAGAAAFAEATKELAPTKGKIVIILDGEVQSAPAVQSEIPNGEVQISGDYTIDDAKSLQTVLESGSLPVNFKFEQSQTVGPTLGQGALKAGVIVALIGLALVMLYLLFFYSGLGFIVAGAMLVFSALYLGILAGLSRLGLFSLSLAGVAGIVLTIGMAADSSILTLERFREEIRLGKSIRAASITGVRHGIMTSIDADLVTMVSALTLFFLAAASVRGFGLTLALGIMCDIIMMLVFKAPLIRLLAPKAIAKHPGFWGVNDSLKAAPYYTGEIPADLSTKISGRFIKRDFNVLKYRNITLALAGLAMVAVIAIVGIKGPQFGIEFVGGTSITFHNTGDVELEDLRKSLAEAGEADATIQTTENDGINGFLVRTTTTSADEAATSAKAIVEKYKWSTEDYEITTIGPDWGSSVIKSSLIAFVVSLLLIILYISIRFRDYKMGVTAVVALLHDLVLVFGIYALLGREITPNTIAAVLTILGYSLYDTVVVFHRINENMKGENKQYTIMSMANHSINEVLIRSMNTSITSLIPVIAMLIFGSATLQDFALAMTIGLIAGVYSSVAIATPLYAIWRTSEKKFKKLVAKHGSDVQRFFLNRLYTEDNANNAGQLTSDLSDGVNQKDVTPKTSSSKQNQNATVVKYRRKKK